ncbi:MAG TPA: neutral zinc metallopeptidase [Archangium sp.]
MKWDSGHRSSNVDDRRGQRAGMSSGMLGPLLMIAGRFGWKGLLVAGVLFVGFQFMTRGDRGQDVTDPATVSQPGVATGADDRLARFSGFVLDDAQQTWKTALGDRFQPARMVLFTDAVDSACGFAESAMGPFYCPRDRRVFLDLSFFDELHGRLGADGDFAQAYVIAHEVGHHVQHQLGLLSGSRGAGAEGQSVRAELQADCLAGVWAHSARQRDLLEPGDIDEALNAASSIGDDRLQKRSQGRVQPESWTHGSSAQRTTWFRRGSEAGTLEACETRRGEL